MHLGETVVVGFFGGFFLNQFYFVAELQNLATQKGGWCDDYSENCS